MTALQLGHKLAALCSEAEEEGMAIGYHIHHVPRAQFDAIDAEAAERHHEGIDRVYVYWRKHIELLGQEIIFFCEEPPVER